MSARVALGAGALLLSACAAVPPLPPPGDEPGVLWARRAPLLEAMSDWSVNGRAAVRGEGIDGRSVRFHWEMAGEAYELSFMSPLGQRVAEIEGGPARAVLRLPDGETRSATSADALLESALGWSAPISSLRHWVRGLPGPSPLFGAEPELDPWGRITTIEEDGWRVELDRYRSVGEVDLPGRLRLEHPRLQIRLVLDDWALNDGAAR